MNKEINKTKIDELQKKYNGVDIETLQKNYFAYINYLEDTCELRIRLVIQKVLDNEELSEEELKIINDYIIFSDPRLLSGQVDGPSSYEMMMKKTCGSGNFNEEEKTFIIDINNKNKSSIKK